MNATECGCTCVCARMRVHMCVCVYVCTQYTQYKRANALGKLNVSAVEIKSVHKKVY